ncbi:hypothetical protein INS49_002758 [Diaporthe citri]|uniref:uncharacterized protein n=1 Tax=Diaporthe citri TaxID=83186 RepID=UPI001C7F3BCA|nr:uncharacterized protein INS49_002758 [Diaporthe citri]KAG6368546.1 hypothetical protein INS49_002758 [Diaporthe citri]
MSGTYQGVQKILMLIEGDLPERQRTLIDLFKKIRFTDILLPVPESGLGLPKQFDDRPADKQRFLKEQKWAFEIYPGQPGTVVKGHQGNSQHYRVDSLDAVVNDPQGYLNHYHVGSKVIMERYLGRNAEDEDTIVSTYRGRRHKQDNQLKGRGGFGSVFQVKIRGVHLAMKLIVRPRSRRPNNDPSSSSGSDDESFWSEQKIVGREGQHGPIGYPDKQQKSFEDEVFVLQSIGKLPLADRRLARIRENHIIEIRAAFTDPQAFGVLLSPVAFFNLQTLLDRISDSEKGSFSESDPAVTFERSQLPRCLGCLAASVAFLHKSKIRHRDLKPKNVLIVPSDTNSVGWKICLCDFATAIIAPESGGPRRGADTERAVIHPWTRDYKSPERHFGLPRTMSEDMWHLGCIFLEVFIVIKGTTRKALQEIFEEREAKRDTELQLYGMTCSKDKFRKWLGERKSDSGETIDFVIDWIEDLLLAEGPDYRRITSDRLLELIHPKNAQGRILFEECCRDFFSCDEGHVQEGLVRGDEGVIFCTEIREATLTPAEDQCSLQPRLLAVISPRMPTFERRLVLCDDAWPFPKPDRFREAWLPVTGIFITRSEGLASGKVIVRWSDFNQPCERDALDYKKEYWLGFKPWDPNRVLDVTFKKPDHAIRFISILTSAEHVARGAQQLPIDNVPAKYDFRLKKTPDEASNSTVARFKQRELQELTLQLSTFESSGVDRLRIISPPASNVTFSGKNFHGMVKELTGWNLLMMCSVSGFDTIRSIRANKSQGPGLLTLWKSETQKIVWLAARLEDSRLGHGKWWYGQVNEIPAMKRHKKKVEVKVVNFQMCGSYLNTEHFNHTGDHTKHIVITFHEEEECIFVGTVRFQ